MGNRVPVGDHRQFWPACTVTPEEDPDSLETVEITQALDIGIEDFDVAFRACGREGLDRRTGGT